MRSLLILVCLLIAAPAVAQIPPNPAEVRAYAGLHAAAAKGDAADIARLIAAGENVNARDAHGRTPLHVAAHLHHGPAVAALFRVGADPNALDAQKYDIVTIAAVNDDVPILKAALAGGCDPKNITSPYNGTALIAAAHLGHAEVVRVLIDAGAPLDHVNNLGWTALIESVSLS
jgi:ankyrin repeat protein